MTDFVFLGPSLSQEEAIALHDAEFLDPVAMGDLYLLVEDRAKPGDRIAIIDGFFEQVPAVWHKEILFAIEHGIEVFGASSMGALRAAELDVLGMTGQGRIYEAYQDGQIEDDDEVAVAHATAEQGYRTLSDAMAAIRLGLNDMHNEGLCDPTQRDELIAVAKAQHYSQRSWAGLAQHAKTHEWNEALVDALRKGRKSRDIKGDDARALLTHLAETQARAGRANNPAQRMQQTSFWQSLVMQSRERALARDTTSLSAADRQIAKQLRAADPDRDRLAQLALGFAVTADDHSELEGWELVDASLAVSRQHGLKSREELSQWRAEQGLDDDEAWRAFVTRFAKFRRHAQSALARSDQSIVDAKRLMGDWSEAQALADGISAQFGSNYYKDLSLADIGMDAEAAQQWYQARLGPMLPTPDEHAQRLGFETLRDYVANLAAVAGVEANRSEAA